MQLNDLFSKIESFEEEMVRTLMELVQVPAIAPENNGEGESLKAERLLQILENVGFDKIERYNAEDQRVPSKRRPSIVAYYYGENLGERLWIVTHLDVVPPGVNSLWTVTNPFEPLVKDGKIYGRGSEDNGQSMVASIFAVKALKILGIKPKRTIALAFVADEEHGNKYGIQHLIKQGIFRQKDLIIVPDEGSEKGDFIEIAEKSMLWFRIRTAGKQTHGSRPDKGLNAHRIGMEYALALDRFLHDKYSMKDAYFDLPESTFEPTRREKNVEAINIIPGEDLTYFDCRILPNYDLEEILTDIQRLAKEFEKKYDTKIRIELLHKIVAPKPTDVNSKIVVLLKDAIRNVRKIEPRVGGVGLGTCAAFFRRVGMPAVVWCTVDGMAHQPDEYAKIRNMVEDAKVFAFLAVR